MMNTNLDSFETALLAELKSVAATGAPDPVRRRGLRVAIGGSVAASLAGIVALGLTVLQPSAAFAVDQTSTGAVVIRIHELSDTQGLEQALADHGIKAVVNYDAGGATGAPVGPPTGALPPGASLHSSTESGTASASLAGPATDSAGGGAPDACGFGDGSNRMPFTSGVEGSDYVITIPAGSPLLQSGRTLDITSSGAVSSGFSGLSVSWTDHGATCGAGTASASAVPAS
jgi:hypothetical protein